MLKIRLQRTGKVNDPYFRVIVTPSTHKAKTGKPTEIVGNHDVQKGKVTFNAPRIQHWMSVGAQPSATVHNMLVNAGILKADKVKTISPKKVKAKKK
jgi:small subunit ribosomal protein S16